MDLTERRIDVRLRPAAETPLLSLREIVASRLDPGERPIRFVVTESAGNRWQCELGTIKGASSPADPAFPSIFSFRKRPVAADEKFNIVLIIPTGIGAALGGHSGDGGALARLMAGSCDTLVTHPNVVNASDINELPANGLYVEGSILTRLLMGTIGLQRVSANRVLVVIGEHDEEYFRQSAVNSVGAAIACFGLQCPEIVMLSGVKRRLTMATRFSPSGRAAGEISNFDILRELLDERRDGFDAVAIASRIDTEHRFREDYFFKDDALNPWGGAEAMLTHAISLLYDVPSAHAPMTESKHVLVEFDVGIVEPRKAAEAVSVSNFHCVLKGLHASPRIIRDAHRLSRPGILTAEDISCVVIPDGCLGLPTLAACEQGIPVVAVRENKNIMKNDLTALPWRRDQLFVVENYWEAVGVVQALRAGVAPSSVRRPIRNPEITNVTDRSASEVARGAAKEASSARPPLSTAP
jgi:hypothetical protein